jgi:hypothetical protein
MADDSRSAKPEAMWMDSIHLDQAHPLIGITLADLGPGEWLRDHRGELLGGAHRPMVDALAFLSSSWRSLSNNLDQGRHDCSAEGGARPKSDWDLLVVVSDDATDDELDLMHAWQVVRDLRIPADVIPVRRSEFEEARDHAGTLARTVVGEGRQIHGNRCSTLSIGSRRMRRHTGIQARQAA